MGDPGKVRRAITRFCHCKGLHVCAAAAACAPGADALRRAPTQKNGEKKLRSQLTHTAEWNNVRLRRDPQRLQARLYPRAAARPARLRRASHPRPLPSPPLARAPGPLARPRPAGTRLHTAPKPCPHLSRLSAPSPRLPAPQPQVDERFRLAGICEAMVRPRHAARAHRAPCPRADLAAWASRKPFCYALIAAHAPLFGTAQGMDALAFVLRNKGCSSLRKTHLMFLARTWGYQSELWCRRDERRAHVAKMDRARAQAAAAHTSGGGAKTAMAAAVPAVPAAPRAPAVKRPAPSTLAPPPARVAKLTLTSAMATVPALMLPRAGAARSTAGGIAAWAVNVRSGAPAPMGAVPAPRPGDDEGAPLAAIAAHVTMTLRPLANESARLFGGSGAADHSEVLAAAEWLRDIAADTAAALSRLRARAAALPRDTARTVAWLHLLNQPCALEDCMVRLQQGLHAATLAHTRGPAAAGLAAQHVRVPVWPEDMVQGALCGLELVARCQALATQSKFTAYGTYIKVTVQLKALIADFTANAANALVLRSARLAAAARAAGAPLRGLAPAPPLLHLSLSDILGQDISEGMLFGGAGADEVDGNLAASGGSAPVAAPPVELLPLPSPLAHAPVAHGGLMTQRSTGSASVGDGAAASSDASGLWA